MGRRNFFTNFQNSLDSSSLKFLKDKFSQKIAAANRYKVKVDIEIFSENITAEKASDLEIFAGYVETILYFLGYKIFEPSKEILTVENIETPPAPSTEFLNLIPQGTKTPAPQPSQQNIDDNPIFYLERTVKGTSVIGMCQKVFNKYVVLKGSLLAPKLSKKGVYQNVKDARKKAKIGENNILLENVFFDSPSAAGSFVTGTSTQGTTSWITEKGVTIAEFLNRQATEE